MEDSGEERGDRSQDPSGPGPVLRSELTVLGKEYRGVVLVLLVSTACPGC